MRTLLCVCMLAGIARAEPDLRKSYVAEHNLRVQRAFLRFSTAPPPDHAADRLEPLRDRDRLLLFHPANDTRVGYGAALFGAVTVFSAHAPAKLRPLFDGPVHI